jgi:hypothetical protein
MMPQPRKTVESYTSRGTILRDGFFYLKLHLLIEIAELEITNSRCPYQLKKYLAVM